MSMQFGKCNFDGKPVDPKDLEQVRPVLTPYGPDGEGYICKDNFGIVHRALHTTKESRLEHQPYVSPSGAVITWDGRLDNRQELTRQLNNRLSNDSTDLSIVTAAYERWGTDAFARLLGDWAVSIWDTRTQSLVLAKDFVGTHHLYYSFTKDQAAWCTILDPLVLFAGKTFSLCEEYVAGWFSFFPAVHLTPYIGIHSVPPSSFVLLQIGKHTINKYWDFDPSKRIRYRTDSEYEEHFRTAFAGAVRRRLRSDSPILAELSGGMDSSSIVCMADTIIGGGLAETPRLDTISYYNDSEPNWNERPYFTTVEQKRGQVGCHIDVASHEERQVQFETNHFAATPGHARHNTKAAGHFIAFVTSQRNRVLLSGIGGDEAMGGVPTPIPELTNLFVRGRVRELAHQLKVWALNKRKPWSHLLCETVGCFLPPVLVGVPKYKRPPFWLQPTFARNHWIALIGYQRRLTLFGPLPSFQENLIGLDVLRRQLACFALPEAPAYETRYPYLDRDLLEFVYSIPREQLVRPGQRRSLMRRALLGIVPDAVLNRKRKAFVARDPIVAIASDWSTLIEVSHGMVTNLMGIVNASRFREALQTARRGGEVPIVHLTRTLAVESWLRMLCSRKDLARVPGEPWESNCSSGQRDVSNLSPNR